MEFELDKEMDSLLRHEARRGLFVAENTSAHLDADEISAFAESALPRMARARATEHLADCDKCRRSLASLIQLNSEAESETIHIENTRVVAARSEDSWFKRLFAFPKVTFAMTAMMLLMTGAIAFVALRSLNEQNASIAQLDPKEEKAPDMDSVASNTSVELRDASNNNSAPANASANSTANTAVPDANTAATPGLIDPLQKSDDQRQQTQQKGGPSGTPGDTDLLSAKDKSITDVPVNPITTDGVLKSEPAPATKPVAEADEKLRVGEQENKNLGKENTSGNVYQNQSQAPNMSPDTQNSRRAPQPPPAPIARSQAEAKQEDRGRTDDSAQGGERATPTKAAKKKEADTRSVGGKTFRNNGGVWTDSAYKGGGTTSVRRGSDEYKKLDGGLQSIGNSFGGTVIVVWGGRAYRIQ